MCFSCAAKGIQIALQVFFFFAHVTLLFFLCSISRSIYVTRRQFLFEIWSFREIEVPPFFIQAIFGNFR